MSEHVLAPVRPVARSNGWWGMVIFVATEATLFGTIFGAYFYLRFRAPHWPPAGVPEPKLTLPLVLTAVLVSTSVPMQLALAAARRGRLGAARWLLALALLLGSGFLAMQVHLIVHDLHELSPRQTAYSSIYFTMLGAHQLHVLVALLLDVWLLGKLARGLTRYRLNALHAATFYWHFVNVLALFVVLVQLSPRL